MEHFTKNKRAVRLFYFVSFSASARICEPSVPQIVPSKAKKKGNIANILGYATSFSSLGMMIASIANLIKK